MIKNLTHWLCCLVLTVLFSGCGGPKYSKPFQEFLGLKLAESAPIKLGAVSVEEMSGTANEAVFSFSGDYVVTEDLYLAAPPISAEPGSAAFRKLAEAGVPKPDVEAAAIDIIVAIDDALGIPIMKVATKKGAEFKMAGKAKAKLNSDGVWGFQILDVNGVTLDGGKAPSGRWVLAGTADEAALRGYQQSRQKLSKVDHAQKNNLAF